MTKVEKLRNNVISITFRLMDYKYQKRIAKRPGIKKNSGRKG